MDYPICIDCGEKITEQTSEWFNEKALSKGQDNRVPKRCDSCAFEWIKRVVALLPDTSEPTP